MRKESPLEGSFGHVRFVIKSAVVFGLILSAMSLLKDLSKPIDDARNALYATPWGLPVLFMAFLPLHLIYEVILIRLAHQAEGTSSRRRSGRDRIGGARPQRRDPRVR